MLTVDYGRLGVQPGDRLLDLGCGAGRHAFEAMRRGADVTALDMDLVELKAAAAVMAEVAAEGPPERNRPLGGARPVQGSALDLPFPDASFDRVIAAEVLEHIHADERAMAELARVLRPGGTMAVTVPRWLPELLNWALSDEYPAPKSPGGHVRIYRERVLVERLAAAGLDGYDRHHAHGLHAPYWWLKCAVGLHDDDHRLVRAYHRLLVDQIVRNPLHLRLAERALQPAVGKSLVVYVRKSS
jgi:SAM-dependent methyltransferase